MSILEVLLVALFPAMVEIMMVVAELQARDLLPRNSVQ
jgi:hypothetical protein